MDISLLSLLHTQIFDFHRGLASNYAAALKNAVELHVNGKEKKQGFFFSMNRAKAGLDDKLYIGNIHRIENHLYWNDEELADDDQIVNVVWVDGPITRDGGACAYGTKDMRDQVKYANTIPQVIGHVFYINTPGGEASARNDYEAMIADCRTNGKPTVAFVDGLCASSGVNLASRCDRVIVMNPRDEFGCIGSMAAFWATPDGAIDRDGSRYVEIVGEDCPAKNDWWREAAQGNYEKLQAQLNKSTQEFHQSVRENRPLVEDWMLTGEIFEAQEVIPALVDEIGDFDRAIECVFRLADGTLPAAQTMVKEDTESTESTEKTEDTERLNGESEEKVITPKNEDNMKENEEKVMEAVAAEAPQTTEAPAQEETPAQEEVPAAEPETPESLEKPEEPTEAPTEEATATEAPTEEATAEEQEATEAQKKPETLETQEESTEALAEEAPTADAQAELDKATDALHSAETLVEKKDKTIAEMQSVIDTKTESLTTLTESFDKQSKQLADALALADENAKTIAELKAANDKLTKQVADLKAEVKELSEKPTPMVTAESGVPTDNATGEAPKQQGSRIKRGMSYQEIREAMKK